ncbi:MAG: hypothetical protein ACOC0O_07140 [Spirochaetota bacterium]
MACGPRSRRFHDAYRSLAYVGAGESHSPDNVVVCFPRRRLSSGGCMLLGNDAVGNTVDASVDAWDDPVERLPDLPVELAAPAHGLRFDAALIEHTVDLIRSVWR